MKEKKKKTNGPEPRSYSSDQTNIKIRILIRTYSQEGSGEKGRSHITVPKLSPFRLILSLQVRRSLELCNRFVSVCLAVTRFHCVQSSPV